MVYYKSSFVNLLETGERDQFIHCADLNSINNSNYPLLLFEFKLM